VLLFLCDFIYIFKFIKLRAEIFSVLKHSRTNIVISFLPLLEYYKEIVAKNNTSATDRTRDLPTFRGGPSRSVGHVVIFIATTGNVWKNAYQWRVIYFQTLPVEVAKTPAPESREVLDSISG